MLKVQPGLVSSFRFLFTESGLSYDPTLQATPQEVIVTVRRGDFGTGPIIDGPYSYNNQPATPDTDNFFEKFSYGEFIFHYKIPENIFEGVYSVVATTVGSLGQTLSVTMYFQVPSSKNSINSVVISNKSSTITNERSLYESVGSNVTSTVMLVGHADGIPLNEPVKIESIEQGMNFLNADLRSPLVKGILNAYSAGCRDIAICASARMSEYVSDYAERNVSSDIFEISQGGQSKTFYEKYYERLSDTYNTLKSFDYIDYIVPLEASIIDTGNVDFISQLSSFCADFHNLTGYVCIGVIGSSTGGFSSLDLDKLESNSTIVNGLTTYNLNGTVATDYGRFVIPVYGEAVYKHIQIKTSYTAPLAASYAGALSILPLSMAMIKKRIPGAMFLFGSNFSDTEYSRMDVLGVNSAFRGKKTRRSYPYEVYFTNEYTMANSSSTLKKSAQMRLVASLVRQIKEIANTYVGRFTRDQLEEEIGVLLRRMKSDGIVSDYSYNLFFSKTSRGDITIDISLLSSLNLKSINFSISAGPVA